MPHKAATLIGTPKLPPKQPFAPRELNSLNTKPMQGPQRPAEGV